MVQLVVRMLHAFTDKLLSVLGEESKRNQFQAMTEEVDRRHRSRSLSLDDQGVASCFLRHLA